MRAAVARMRPGSRRVRDVLLAERPTAAATQSYRHEGGSYGRWKLSLRVRGLRDRRLADAPPVLPRDALPEGHRLRIRGGGRGQGVAAPLDPWRGSGDRV